GASGEAAKGQAAIEEILAGFLSGPYKGAQLTVETTSIRFIKPHLAVSDSRWEVSDVPEAEGEQPPTKGLSTTVLVKEDDQWKLAAHRSRVPFSPPSREQ
ncbi:MAG: SgcJ/EcaC family oxidoreductase, partial [Acidobacteriota bacterium]